MFTTIRAVQILTVTSCLTMSAVHAQNPNFFPGQILTRFSEGTSQRETVAQVSQTIPLDLGGLVNVIAELSARAGVPLRLHQLGSGYWLTLDVDREMLPDHVRSIVSSQEGVRSVMVVAPADANSAVQYVVDAADGSGLERAINRRRGRGLPDLMDVWTTAVGLRLQYTVDDGHLMLSIDWNAGTLELVERFKAMPEIEAAQPNYRMGLNSQM